MVVGTADFSQYQSLKWANIYSAGKVLPLQYNPMTINHFTTLIEIIGVFFFLGVKPVL